MGGFTKLFSRILISSVWSESNETRIVWITLLALTGPDGVAKITLPGLSRLAVIPLPEVEKAILTLSSPDQYSRTAEHEGRRIKEVRDDAGNLVGYFLYNYAKHRAVDATSAERQKRYRASRDGHARQKNRRQKTEVRVQKTETTTSTDSSGVEVVNAYNEVFGTKLESGPGNLKAARRALAEGYSLEAIRSVFVAVRDKTTETAAWCHGHNREFEYLIRPAYKKAGEPTQGPLDKIPNELATGRKATA